MPKDQIQPVKTESGDKISPGTRLETRNDRAPQINEPAIDEENPIRREMMRVRNQRRAMVKRPVLHRIEHQASECDPWNQPIEARCRMLKGVQYAIRVPENAAAEAR